MTDQTVQILVRGTLDAEVLLTNVINGLVVDHERTIGVLQRRMGGEDGVVRLDDGSRHLGCWVDGEFKFCLM